MAEDFLPPDPHAEAPPTPRPPAARPAYAPPDAARASGGGRGPSPARNDRAVMALALGAGALAVLVFTVGGLFFLTLPFSIAAWILGARLKEHVPQHPHAGVAVLLGIIGTVLGVVAGGLYIAIGPSA